MVTETCSCPVCAGSGVATVYVLYPSPPLGVYRVRCTVCHGSGAVESTEVARRIVLERRSLLTEMEREIARARRLLGLEKGEFRLDGGELVVAGVRM